MTASALLENTVSVERLAATTFVKPRIHHKL